MGVVVSAPLTASCAEVEFVPAFDWSGRYSNNVAFSRNSAKEDFWTTLSPSLFYRSSTEEATLRAEAALDVVRYATNHQLNDTRPRLSLSTEGQTSENLRWSTSGSYIENTTTDSQWVEGALGVIPSRVTQWGPMASVQGQWDERTSLGFQGYWQRTEYERPNYADYDTTIVSTFLQWQMDDRNSSLEIRPQFTQNVSVRSRVQDYSVLLGTNVVLDELWKFSAFAGPHVSKTQYFATTPLATDEVRIQRGGFIDLSVTRNGQANWTTLKYQHTQAYGLNSQPTEMDTLSLTSTWAFSEEVKTSLWATLSRRWASDDIDRQNVIYGAVSPSLAWKFAENHLLSAHYTYDRSTNRRLADNKTAERNSFWLTLHLSFPERW
jgi:hypothetical protein